MYEYGQGVSQSHEEAEKWYRLAEDQGQPDAKRAIRSLEKEGYIDHRKKQMLLGRTLGRANDFPTQYKYLPDNEPDKKLVDFEPNYGKEDHVKTQEEIDEEIKLRIQKMTSNKNTC